MTTMRIAFLGIEHESLPSSPIRADDADLIVWRGEEILETPGVSGTFCPSTRGAPGSAWPKPPEMWELVESLGIEPVPILLARQLDPSGAVSEATYIRFRDEIVERLRKAGTLDGVCMMQHGAMMVENIWYGDTDLARAVRSVVGRDVPITARCDLHGNITEEWANAVDIWAGFRTAPHEDAEETLERALTGLVQSIRLEKRPCPVFIRLPMLITGEQARTDKEPMASLLAAVRQIEEKPGILNAELFVGFAWQDTACAGVTVVVVAEDAANLPLARGEAESLAKRVWDHRHDFNFNAESGPADEAIDLALSAPESPVFISDSGDMVVAGAPGDNTYRLSRLLAKNAPDAVYAGIADGEAAQACIAGGVGSTITTSLGAKMDMTYCRPITVTGVVEHIHHPIAERNEAALVTLRVGGVRVLISDRRKGFLAIDDFRKAGVEPAQHKIVVVKQGYLMPELGAAAEREILALTPGYSDLDLTRLRFNHVTRPIYPLDDDFGWRPQVSNSAGYVD